MNGGFFSGVDYYVSSRTLARGIVLRREIRRRRFLIFGFTQPLTFLSIAVDFPLVLLDLLLVLLILRLFLTLHVISNERAGTQTQGPTDSSASPGTPHGCANNAPGRGAAKNANARSLFPGRHGTAGTSGEHTNGKTQREYL